MTKSSIILSLTVIALTALFSCEKTFTPIVSEDTALGDRAQVKYANFVVNSNRNYVFIDNRVISGTASAFTNIYPSGASSNMLIAPGSRTFVIRDTLRTSTQVQISLPSTLEAGAFYTMFTYDSLNNAKAKIFRDWFLPTTDTTANVRFANFGYNPTGVPNVDVYSARRQANIFSNVTFTNMTDFVPFRAASLDTLYIRQAGTTTNLVTLNGFNPLARRNYTIALRGSMRLTSGTLARGVTTILY